MFENLLYEEKVLLAEKKKRRQYCDCLSVENNLVDEYINKGWEIEKTFTNKTRIKREKKKSQQIENEVWLMFYNMGFTFMSKDNIKIKCESNSSDVESFSFNIITGDEDTILLISCHTSDKKNMQLDMKKDNNAFKNYKDKLMKIVRKEFGSRKVAFILATKNIYISKEDKDELASLGINHFDDDKIEYYKALANHLGCAAKYQLLGTIFEGMKIQGITNIIPAIKGEMGGHTYYSFSIEPEVLLKLGYVLHRSDSHKDMMPTYQRIIKKDRLKNVTEFVNQGGYFPNSIIVSINEGKKSLNFDIASQNNSTSNSKIGLLHLPQMYRSIYIIDGQHRLYGYSKTEYKSNCTIPVVAFVNLKKDEQIKLFMEINENQKSVSKNLRNTLEEDMKYSSSIAEERMKALTLKIARNLGEDSESPLFDRVIIGENVESQTKNITLEAISKAINNSEFLPRYKKNDLLKNGLLDCDNNDRYFELLYPIFCKSLTYISGELGNEWEKGGKIDKTAFVVNNSITALIKVLNDICIYLNNSHKVSINNDSIEKIYLNIIDYLDPIIKFWCNLSEKERMELRTSYGGGGVIKYWRTFQKVINSEFNDFSPDGMNKYWDGQSRENTIKAKEIIGDIELFLKEDVSNKLQEYYGENWFSSDGIPKKVYIDSEKLATEKNYELPKEEAVDAWDCLNLIHYREIMLFSKNWSEIFQNFYTDPALEKNGKKDDKTKWLVKLNEIRNTLVHSHVISTDNYNFLNEIKNWLIVN